MKNLKEKLKTSKGITLVALVVTIIVLLILAGVALSSVLSQDGIFSRAEQATDKYGQAKARETLEMALGEAQMQKYEEGLTEEQLDNKIGAIEGELLPKEKPENPNLQNVIVDGYIFEIDRSVPKIVDYIGPADGVVITAVVSGNNGWLKPGEENVTVTGTIKTYSGGTITSYSAKKGESSISNFSIDANGRYLINNITEDTTIVINATDSTGEKGNKAIQIKVKVDSVPPVVDGITAETKATQIFFSATGHDNESGLKHFNYTISSTQDKTLEGIPSDKKTGTFTQGQIVEIITTPTGNRDETTYTITVTATDNCDNISSIPKTENVIAKKVIPVTGIKIDKEAVYMGVGDTEKLTVSIEPSNATNKDVELISSNPEIVEISEENTIVGKKFGTVTITAKSKQNSSINCSITVKVGERITLSEVPVSSNGDVGTHSLTMNPPTLTSNGSWHCAYATFDLPQTATGLYCEGHSSGAPYVAVVGVCLKENTSIVEHIVGTWNNRQRKRASYVGIC